MQLSFFPEIYSKRSLSTYTSVLTPLAKFKAKKGSFSPNVRKWIQSHIFFEKNFIFLKVFSGHTQSSFDNSAKTVSPKNWKFRSFHKTQKFLVSPKNSSSKHSTGHVKCLLDDHGVFRQVKMFSAKPWKDIIS